MCHIYMYVCIFGQGALYTFGDSGEGVIHILDFLIFIC